MKMDGTFVAPQPLPDLSKVKSPTNIKYSGDVLPRAFTVRYEDPSTGSTTQRTLWKKDIWWGEAATVKGTFAEAVKAAQDMAVYAEDPSMGYVTSASILDAGNGAWYVSPNQYLDPPDMDMPAHVSVPIDPVTKKDVHNSIFYTGEAKPKVTVRMNDPKLVAVVGRDVWVPGVNAPKLEV